MQKKFHNVLLGISVLPALLVLPAWGEIITTQQVIENGESIELSDVTANGLDAGVGGAGAAYYVFNGGLTLNDSEFSGNVAMDETYGLGGALFNMGTMSINGSSFTGNSSFVEGGAVDNWGTLTVKNSVFGGINDGDGNTSWFGGAIGGYGGMIDIEESAFVGNSVSANGGAIYVVESNLVINGNSEFRNNTSTCTDENCGGGAIMADTSNVEIENTLFVGNSSLDATGAVHIYGEGNVSIKNTKFFNNTAQWFSGALTTTDGINNTVIIDQVQFGDGTLANANVGSAGGAYWVGEDTKITSSRFDYNKATEFDGGAIFVGAGANAEIINSYFANNNANANGGAIATRDGAPGSSLTITGDGTELTGFINNSAVYGGAIWTGVDTSIANTTFVENTATEHGGAIYNNGVVTFDGTMRFDGNSAGIYGGAIYGNDGYMTFNDAVTFDGNTAAEDGGAVYWYSINGDVEEAQRTLTFKKTATFTNNSGESGWGGALYTLGSIVKFEDGATFTNNSVFNGGGAIYTDRADLNISGTSNFTNNTANEGGAVYNTEWGRVDISGDATFANNTATEHGGAIYNGIYQDDEEEAGLFTIANATFTGNSANQGGAIYNDNLDDATDFVSMEIANATFNGNTATEEGGAIYNLNGMTFAGTNSFSGNTAADVANDIYNAGTLTLADGSTTTIDGGITGDGTLNIANGATFNLGTASVTQGTMVLDGTLNATLKDADNFAFFVVGDEFNGDGTLNFDLRAAGEYNVFQGALFDKDKVSVSGGIFDWDWNEDFDTIVATMKSTEEIAAENGISNEAATTVANLVNSASGQLNDFAVAIQDKLSSGDADTAAAVEHAHAAIHPETESVVQTVAMSVQNTVANLAAGRLAALGIGRNGGDVNVTGGGVWAQGIYNKSKQNGAFNGYTRGVTGGVDMTLDRVLTLGAGYSYAHSDMAGTARDTDVDSSTIFAYGQYKPTDWFVHAMANYTMSDYSEHAVVLGTNIDANYDVRAYGGQVMTGYDFAGGITPAIGVRYMHISADEYKNSLGIKNKLQDSDYMTAMLETKWTYGFQLSRGLMLRPELRYAVKYDFMSDEQTATILLPGVDSYVMDGNRLSRLGAEFGGGLGMKFSGLDLSVNYDIEIREGFTSQTGRVRVRYEF